MAKRRWLMKNKIPQDLIVQFPDIPSNLLQVLYNRGIVEPENIKSFLKPVYAEHINDPFLLPDMPLAVERTLGALARGERITVYADYDADAVTAAALMIRTLKSLGGNVDYYIPDRFSEGYGVNLDAIKEIAARGSKLVITVDCGITALDEVEAAQTLGMDVVITDHHHVPKHLPKARAVINPHRQDSLYPFRDLTGVGVAFKFAQAILSTARSNGALAAVPPEGYEKWLLDLVAIGTVADCQSLLGENRVLVKYGLYVLAKTRWPGLQALLRVVGIEKDLNTGVIGFAIAPRINAAGRIAQADIALKLLLTDNAVEAGQLAWQLEKLNRQRQQMTEGLISEAREQIEKQIKKNKVLFAASAGWPKGVVGLVAGKLSEEYYRPVLVASKDEKYATGSARSIPNFNIMDAFNFAAAHAVRFGGHAAAAGFTVANDKIYDFHVALCEYAESKLSESDLEPTLVLDGSLENITDFSVDFAEMLENLSPFGPGNPRPCFLIRNLKVENVRAMGSDNKHAQIYAVLPEVAGLKLRCIAFKQGYLTKALKPGDTVNMAAELLLNRWNGGKKVEIKLIDWQRSK